MNKFFSLFIALFSLSTMVFAQSSSGFVSTAIELTEGVTTDFESYDNGNHVLYAKFTASDDGTVTVHMNASTTYARWMEEGVMAYGSMRLNLFRDGNKFDVVKGHTYYLYYMFPAHSFSVLSYELTPAAEGSTRNKAILISEPCTQPLLGKAREGDDYYNTTTWFRLAKGTFPDMKLLSVTIGGGNTTYISLFKDGVDDPLTSYSMGEGSGMLPFDSKVLLDIDLSSADYYVSITQDDVNGTATFAFSKALPGMTIGTAIEAHLGSNFSIPDNWYKYTHSGDNMISISDVTRVVDERRGNVAVGEDVYYGFRMGDGQSVYFQATSTSFDITASEVKTGTVPDKPIVITLDSDNLAQFSFSLHGSTSDVRRYMLFTAPANGEFMYGTSHPKVIDVAFGSTVRDVTEPDASSAVSVIQKLESDYGMFIYKWEVKAGHSYLIEQTLVDNLGDVEFLATFTAAHEGESIEQPIMIELGCAEYLGRVESSARYFKFTAPESGDYLLTAFVSGRVHVYGEDEYNVPKDYTNGTDFHKDIITLSAGDTFLFSVAPSANVDNISGEANSFFVPDYYVVIHKDKLPGTDKGSPLDISESSSTSADASCTWYGPITVPADKTLKVVSIPEKANDLRTSVFFVNEKSQWIASDSQIYQSTSPYYHIYTLAPQSSERVIYLMSNPFAGKSTWYYTFETPNLTSVSGIQTNTATQASKYLHNGRVVIRKGNAEFNLQGTPIQTLPQQR